LVHYLQLNQIPRETNVTQFSTLRQGISGVKSLTTSIHKNIDKYHQWVMVKRDEFSRADRSISYSTILLLVMVLLMTGYQAYSLKSELIRRKLV
jgi:aspartyl-tRNA synthetase